MTHPEKTFQTKKKKTDYANIILNFLRPSELSQRFFSNSTIPIHPTKTYLIPPRHETGSVQEQFQNWGWKVDGNLGVVAFFIRYISIQ